MGVASKGESDVLYFVMPIIVEALAKHAERPQHRSILLNRGFLGSILRLVSAYSGQSYGALSVLVFLPLNLVRVYAGTGTFGAGLPDGALTPLEQRDALYTLLCLVQVHV
jgi:hypothetical protein